MLRASACGGFLNDMQRTRGLPILVVVVQSTVVLRGERSVTRRDSVAVSQHGAGREIDAGIAIKSWGVDLPFSSTTIDFTSGIAAMLSFNRLGVYFFLFTVVFIIFLHLRTFTSQPGPAGIGLSSDSIYRLPPKTDSSKFDWAQRQQRYPVQTFTSLPVASGQHLPRVQYAFDKTESTMDASERKQRLAQVKAAMTRSWAAYRKHAWLSDEVLPVSGGSRNSFGGWAATYVP